jgi:predicted PurR-regulated permease PerM
VDATLPGPSARRIVATTLTWAGVGVLLFLALHFVEVFLAFFVAILVAAAGRPLVQLFERLGVSRSLASIIAHAMLVAVALTFAVLALPLLLEQGAALYAELPTRYDELRKSLLGGDSVTLRRIALALPRAIAKPQAAGLDSMASALAWGATVATIVLTSTAVLILSHYWTVQGELTTRSWVLLVPAERRQAITTFVGAASEKLSAYIRGQLIVCVAVGAFALVAYLVIGLPNAFALAAVAGVLEAVPVIGPTLGAVPAGLVALTIDPVLALYVAGATIVIQLVENYLLVPRVMDRAVGVGPMVTILAIAAFGSLFGVVGALLAIPLAALLQLVFERVIGSDDAGAAPARPRGRGQISALRYELSELVLDLRKWVRTKADTASATVDATEDELEGIARDLDYILERDEAEAAAAADEPRGGPR